MWNNPPFDQDTVGGAQGVLRAIEFAAWAHSIQPTKNAANEAVGGLQTRFCHKTGMPLPYIVHPIRVVSLLEQYGEDFAVQRAGAAHDILEDTKVKLNELENVIGRVSLELVMWVTDHEFKGSRDLRSWLKDRKIALAPREAQAIKLADMVNNTESLGPDKAAFWQNTRRAEMINLAEICRESNLGLALHLAKTIDEADERMPPKEK